jgi:Protein of unknown function (DUF2281)
MITLEMAIQKIQQLPPEQRNQVIQFIEFLDFKFSQTETIDQQTHKPDSEQEFFELAGLWENKDITAESLRAEAWREEKQ